MWCRAVEPRIDFVFPATGNFAVVAYTETFPYYLADVRIIDLTTEVGFDTGNWEWMGVVRCVGNVSEGFGDEEAVPE